MHPMQPVQAELTEPQHALDPAVGRLGNPLAPAVRPLARVDLQLGGHDRSVWVLPRIDSSLSWAVLRQLLQRRPQVFAHRSEFRLPAPFRDEHHVVFAIPESDER